MSFNNKLENSKIPYVIKVILMKYIQINQRGKINLITFKN